MSNVVIALLVALGASAWIFSHLQNTSGRNTRQSLTATSISGSIIFVIVLTILGLVI